MISYSDGKTTYSDGDSLSGDLGKKVRNDDKKALQELKKFASNKDPEQPHSQARALYELGEVYFSGWCEVEKSAKEAIKYWHQAAALNDDRASLRLGELYRDGKQGFNQDGQKALEYFLKATEVGNQQGYKLAAEMFQMGTAVKADGYRAIEFYEKLDALDDKDAAMSIAQIYEEGCGRLKANGYKALEIYEEIISHGKYWAKINREMDIESPRLENYKEALNNAARICLKGKAGVSPDGHKAIEYFSELVENDEADAMVEIARICLEGKGGVEPNGDKAIEYFKEIIQRNDFQELFANPTNALYAIAKIYRYGKGGVAQDGQKAVECYKKLSKNEHSSGLMDCKPDDAFYELGNIYEEGCGSVEPDMQKAVEFYQKAAELENYFAKRKLKSLISSEDE